MKKWNEGVAALVAILTSGGVLAATFGLARLMEKHALYSNGKLTVSPLSSNAAQGRDLFLLNCAHCHGDDARGDEGPNLYDLHKSDARIRTVITSGIKGEMPSFAKKLSDSDVKALTDYLRTLRT